MKRHTAGKLTVALVLALSLVLAWSAVCAADQATPLLPAGYYGQVFVQNHGGELLRESAVVAVYLAGDSAPRGTPMALVNGWYGGPGGEDPKYVVPGTAADLGKRVLFYVNGVPARTYVAGSESTVTFQEGDVRQVDLVVPAPAVEATDPEDNATGVPVNKTISVTFTTDVVAGASYDQIAVRDASGQGVRLEKELRGKVLSLRPVGDLSPGTRYMVVLPAGAVKDAATGIPLAAQVTFSFETSGDTVAPTVRETDPADGAKDVPVDKIITVRFSEAVKPGLAFESIVLRDEAGDVVPAEASVDPAEPSALVIRPTVALAHATRFTVVLPAGAVEDLAGNALAGFSFTFTTVAAPVTGPVPEVESVDPATAVSGKPDQTASVAGRNFQDGARVVLCREGQADTVVTAVYRSATELAFTVPVDLAPGLYTVKVRNPDGQTSADHVTLTLYAGEIQPVQVFPGVAGTQPGEIRPDGALRVEVPVRVAQAYQSALVVIRVDDPDGRPMLAAVEGPLPANTAVKFSAGFNLPGKAGTYTVKAFVWDGWQTMGVLAEAYEGAFAAGDTTPPAVASTDPANGATGVPVDKVIKVTFGEPVVEGPHFTDISLVRDGSPVDVTRTVSGTVVSIQPVHSLAYGTTYTVTVPAGAVKDVAGNLLTSALTFSFTTAAAPDTAPPTVVSTDPENDATDVPVGKTITVTFSEDVQPGPAYHDITLTDAAGSTVAVDKSVSGRVLTLDPVTDLAAGTAYTVTIPAGAVRDLAGNGLAQAYTFGFTTKAAPAPGLELRVGTVSAAPGSTVQVPVILTSQGQVAAFEFVLAYDSGLLTYQAVDKGQLTSAWTVQGNVLEPGRVKVVAYHPNLEPAASGTGSVAVFTFQVAADAASEASCDLTLQGVVLSDATGAQLTGVNLVNGRFTVP